MIHNLLKGLLIGSLISGAVAVKAKQSDDTFLPALSPTVAQTLSQTMCTTAGCTSPTIYMVPVLSLPCNTLGHDWIQFEPNGTYGSQLLSVSDRLLLHTYANLDSDGCFPSSP